MKLAEKIVTKTNYQDSLIERFCELHYSTITYDWHTHTAFYTFEDGSTITLVNKEYKEWSNG